MRFSSLTQNEVEPSDQQIVKCIEHVFSGFDEKVSAAVFSKFERDYGLERRAIAQNPELFADVLKKSLRFGSAFVEKALVNELRASFHVSDGKCGGFAETIAEIRRMRT